MKIKLLAIGKTDDKNLIALIDMYQQRLKHYIGFELQIIPDIKNVKNLSQAQQKEKELEIEVFLIKIDNIDLFKTVIQKKFFNGEEFEWFSWEYGRFCKWKSLVMQTNYDFYYWLDSV